MHSILFWLITIFNQKISIVLWIIINVLDPIRFCIIPTKKLLNFFTKGLEVVKECKNINDFEMITMERKLGQAYFNLGEYADSRIHFANALDAMGIEIPEKSKVSATLKKRSKTVMSYTKQKKAELNKQEIVYRKREANLILFTLSKVFFQTCSLTLAYFCSKFALEISEDTGSASRSESLAMASITHALFENKSLFDQLIKDSKEKAGKQLDLLKTINQISGIYALCGSKFDEAIENFTKGTSAAQSVGDISFVEECNTQIATCMYYKADVKKAIELNQTALDSAVKRGDAQHQIFAAVLQWRNFLAIGDFEKIIQGLEEISESINISFNVSQLCFYSMQSLVKIKQGDLTNSLQAAEKACQIFFDIEHTHFELAFPLATLFDTYFILLNKYKDKKDLKEQRKNAESKLKKLFPIYENYAKIFEFSNVRLQFFKGYQKFVDGKVDGAKKEWQSCANKSLPLETAYVLYYQGLLLNENSLKEEATKLFSPIANCFRDLSEIDTKTKHTKKIKNNKKKIF